MSKQHSPGPWGWAQDSLYTPGHIITGDKRYIASICVDDRPKNENIANARLIAAAPELLAAIKNLLDGYKALNHKGLLAHDVEMARAAIAKARGE